ncbi:MAG: DinB family protein [Sediminibacterium sp. Gen4]|nr:DinB family protein [Sediminibacterium sp. Gen4]
MISCILIFFCSTVGIAQTVAPDSVKAQLIKDWERAKTYTAEYLAAMPADKYTAKPVEGIRSFAEQMLHLAQGSIGLSANGTGKTRIFPGYNMEKSATAQSKDSVSYYVNASYDFAIDGIKAMDANQLGELVKRGNLNESRLSWIMKGFEHQTHHRGQCTIYIRLQGVTPPNEKLF